MTLVLNDEDVAKVLTMEDTINVLEKAFHELGLKGAVNAPRRDCFMALSNPDAHYSFKTIEGGLESLGVVAQRINSDMVTYPKFGSVTRRVKIPAAPGNRYVGLVFLYSTETLELLAIITDGHIQRMRVAGTTGVGVKYLARSDARTAALLGTGWQAETAAWALAAARSLSTIRVYSPNPENRKAFAEKVSMDLGVDTQAIASAEEAVRGADIVACATNSSGPVVDGNWIVPGTHLSCIIPNELDDMCWQKSDLIICSSPMGAKGFEAYQTGNPSLSGRETMTSQRDAEEKRAERFKGKCYMLSDMLVDKAPKRTSSTQITMMYKIWGLGIEFASVGHLVYERARAAGIGNEIPTEWFSQTSHP